MRGWTDEQLDYLYENYGRQTADVIGALIGKKAGTVRMAAAKYGMRSGLRDAAKPGDIRTRYRSATRLGMESGRYRVNMLRLEHGWVRNDRHVWEQVNGRTLPDTWMIGHLDGDLLNDAPDNLVAVSPKDRAAWYERFPLRYAEWKRNLHERSVETEEVKRCLRGTKRRTG